MNRCLINGMFVFEFVNERNYQGINVVFNSKDSFEKFLECLNVLREETKILKIKTDDFDNEIISKIGLKNTKIKNFKGINFFLAKGLDCEVEKSNEVEISGDFGIIRLIIKTLNNLVSKNLVEFGMECKNDTVVFWYFRK